MSAERLFLCFCVFVLAAVVSPQRGGAQKRVNELANDDTSEIGYLKVDVGPLDSLYVVVDRNFDSPYYIESGDTLALQSGERNITLAMKQTRDRSFPVSVSPGTTEVIKTFLRQEKDRETYLETSSYPVLRNDVNLVVVTDQDSRISVDGESMGKGHIRLRVSEGNYRIQTSHPKAGQTERLATVQEDPPRLTRMVLYNTPSWREVQNRSIIPGLAQLHKGGDLKGISLLSGFVVASVGAVQQSLVFASRNQEYEAVREEYEKATTEEEAFQLGSKSERLYQEARGAYWRRNILIGAATGIYLYSLFDAWLNRPVGGYRTPLTERARVEPLLGTRRQGVRLVVRF